VSNSPRNETEILKEKEFNDFDLGIKNENKYIILENNLNNTIDIKKKEKKEKKV